jgi:parvulin-like peptidyl-prolyl isomerase
MAYMSKTKKRRVRRQRLVRGLIALGVIAAVLIVIWQVSLGSTLAKVGGVAIRGGMVDGVAAFLEYYQTGAFPDNSTEGMTDEEIAQAEDMALVDRNSIVQNVFVGLEVLKQYFAAEGIVFPSEEDTATIASYVDMFFGNANTKKQFDANGERQAHVEYYFTYSAAMTVYRDHVLEANPITDEERQAYYDENPDYWVRPMTMQASHILLLDSEHTQERLAEIEAILERINNGEDFAVLAMEYSEDEGSAANGGDLGSFSQGEMVAPFEEAAMALEIGEVSGIVETDYGYHIIKLTGRTEASISTLEENVSSIDSVLAGKRVTEAMEALVAKADVVYFGLITPSTGKPPINLTDLEEARGTTADAAGGDAGEEAAAE